jgi:electron transfer flavoprotein alpha subunit
MKIIAFSEDLSYVNIASAVGKKLEGYVIAISLSDMVKSADEIHVIDKIDEEFISDYIVSLTPEIIIVGNTKRDRSIASRTAGLLRASLATDVNNIELKGNKLMISRIAYSGMGIIDMELQIPAVITISKIDVNLIENKSKIIKVQTKSGRIKIIETVTQSGAFEDLSSAQIIVSVGRGIGSKENVRYAEELAKALGAALGGSRPVTTELGWLPESKQIGLSGNKVRPKLYIALGISGQPQHLAGIKDSKIIVAVNKDKNAPIVENADYVIIGDAVQFCNEMIKRLSK